MVLVYPNLPRGEHSCSQLYCDFIRMFFLLTKLEHVILILDAPHAHDSLNCQFYIRIACVRV